MCTVLLVTVGKHCVANFTILYCLVRCIAQTVYTLRKGNDNAIPLQGWTDPGGSRTLRLPDFKTIGT